MSLELYINEKQIQLSDKSRIGLTFQANDIGDMQSRNSNFSNQFKIPKTAKNADALGYIDNVNTGSSFAYKNNVAKFVQDGIEIMPEGTAKAQDTDEFFNVIVTNGNKSFFDLIDGKKIIDLNWTDQNHDYTMANAIFSNGFSSGYTYPLIDWGADYDTQTNAVYPTNLLPCFYFKDFLERVGVYTGYEIKGSFINSDQYKRLIITPNSFKYTDAYLKIFTSQSSNTIEQTMTHVILTGSGTNNFVNNPVFQISGHEFSGNFYNPTLTRNGALTFTGNIHFFAGETDNIAHPLLNVDIVDDTTSTVLATANVYVDGGGFALQNGDIPFFVTTGDIDIIASHSYQARITLQTDSGSVNYNSVVKMSVGSLFSFKMTNKIPYLAPIFFGEIFDNLQKEIIQDVCNMYYLQVTTDEVKGTVTFNYFNDLTKNIPFAKDISKKVDVSNHLQIKTTIGSYSQKNNLKYNPNDTVTVGYGDYYFNISNELLPIVGDAVQLKFVATEYKIRLLGYFMPKIKALAVGNAFTDVGTRILLMDKHTIPTGVLYHDPYGGFIQTDNIPFCYFKRLGVNDNLGFDDSLINNYETIVQMLDKCKAIYPLIRLDAVDISQLDYLTPVFLDIHTNKVQVNGYFYLNKIDNYTDGRSTKCELIKI